MLTAAGDELSVRLTVEGGATVSVDLETARVLWSDLGKILAVADKAELAAQAAAKKQEKEVTADAERTW